MKADYVHKDTLTATDYVELNKNNELLISYNQALLKENQELKKKYENAVADYETTMFEKEQLNSLVNSCQEEIRQLKKQLHEASLTIQEMIEQDIECPSNCEKLRRLTKQLEEWKHHLKCSKEMLNIQGQKGNYDYDEYMLGLYNGMEYIIALFETREPNYISGKDVEFTNNKTQQKDFIEWLEDGIKSSSALDTINKQTAMYIYSTTLRKYKETIGLK